MPLARLPKVLLVMLPVGIVIFAIYLYFSGFWDVLKVILTANPFYMLVAFAIDTFCIILFAEAWVLLVNSGKRKLSFKEGFEIILASIFGDLVVPTASFSGEVLRIGLTSKRGNLPASEVSATVLLHRLLHGLTFSLALGIGIIAVLITKALTLAALEAFIFVGIVVLALSVLGLYGLFNVWKFHRPVEVLLLKIESLYRRFNKGHDVDTAKAKLREAFENFSTAIMVADDRVIAFSAFLLAARWFIVALVPYVIFMSLDYPISYWIVFLVCIVVSLVQMMPIGIPGLLGVMELSMTTAFMGFGVPLEIAVSATLLTRVVLFWYELIIGGIAAFHQGVLLTQIYSSASSDRVVKLNHSV